MAPSTAPKAIIFDIGGVCALSPLEAIADYENKNNIPHNWINFAISRSAPNGFWQRLERGEVKMDAEFFRGFNSDLRNQSLWKDFNDSFKKRTKKLKDFAVPTQLGDPVSLKAEAADTKPTEEDRRARSASSPTRHSNKKEPKELRGTSLSKLAKDTTIGDPVSLESEEVAQSDSTFSQSSGPIKISSPNHPESTIPVHTLPSVPDIDGEALFWSMMAHARNADPYVFPALLRLNKLPSPQKPILAALSNTVIFPPSHPYNRMYDPPDSDLRKYFDIFIASAEVGIRKPDPAIYEFALEKLNKCAKQRWGHGIRAEECVFLDDIGENLKPAGEMGLRTIKVMLGKTWRAVKELEQATGFELMDEKTRRSKL
ncbi:MAG: hypothetical protein Q9214_002644 [Letrouitia sp. 1 TL-2023]